MVKRLPAMQETRVQSLGILAWRIPRMEDHGRLQSMGSQKVGHDWASFTFHREYSQYFNNNFKWSITHKSVKLLCCTPKTNIITQPCVCVYMCSVLSDSVTPWTVAHQALLSMEFPRQEYRSALPFPTPGDLPDPGIEPASLASPTLAGGFFTTVPPGKPAIQMFNKNRLFPIITMESHTEVLA